MQADITTIPELLVRTRGNMTEVSRLINCYRSTVKKYAKDVESKGHVILNGVLMIKHKGGSRWKDES